MIRNGAKPTRIDHRDLDFHQSHFFAGTLISQLPDTLLCDAGLTMPNQEMPDTEFVPPTPAMPYGCTDFAQAELATDLTKQIHDPLFLEQVTHANASGGYDIRQSLIKAVCLGWFKQFYNITASAPFDMFDSLRLAQVIGLNAGELRSITWGTPWFTSWENAAQAGVKIMPMPTAAEMASIKNMPWHDSKLDGFSNQFDVVPGTLLYRDKSWQGTTIGFLYFPREVINAVMKISGTVAFTPSNTLLLNPVTISVTTLQLILSILRNILSDVLSFNQ